MSARVIHIDRSLPDLVRSDAAAWELWLVRHGLPDPDRIPISNVIVCDDSARTISLELHKIGSDGKWIIEDDDRGRGHIARDLVTVQLEAPALPIPPGYQVTIA